MLNGERRVFKDWIKSWVRVLPVSLTVSSKARTRLLTLMLLGWKGMSYLRFESPSASDVLLLRLVDLESAWGWDSSISSVGGISVLARQYVRYWIVQGSRMLMTVSLS